MRWNSESRRVCSVLFPFCARCESPSNPGVLNIKYATTFISEVLSEVEGSVRLALPDWWMKVLPGRRGRRAGGQDVQVAAARRIDDASVPLAPRSRVVDEPLLAAKHRGMPPRGSANRRDSCNGRRWCRRGGAEVQVKRIFDGVLFLPSARFPDPSSPNCAPVPSFRNRSCGFCVVTGHPETGEGPSCTPPPDAPFEDRKREVRETLGRTPH